MKLKPNAGTKIRQLRRDVQKAAGAWHFALRLWNEEVYMHRRALGRACRAEDKATELRAKLAKAIAELERLGVNRDELLHLQVHEGQE